MSSMRAGISGTNWTGKSVTIRRLLEQHADSSIDVVSMSQLASRCPYPMVEEQTLDASRWMIDEVRSVIASTPIATTQLFDRSPLDIGVFTLLAQERAGSDGDGSVVEKAFNLLSEFDCVFFVPVTDAWPPNGTVAPPLKRGFALLVDRYMRRAIADRNIPVVHLPWDLDDRCKIVAEALRL